MTGAAAPRPLAARSVVLSLLLGAHPPELPVRDLVRTAGAFGVAEATLRVALSRMVAAGDLLRTDGTYRLSERLLARQRRQDEAVDPHLVDAGGRWELAVVTVSGRGAAERARLRTALTDLRLAELREGVWTRPANLPRPWPDDVAAVVTRFDAAPEGPPAALAAALWDLGGWAATGHALLAGLRDATDAAPRLAVAAAIVRHLLSDPVLPPELLPPRWPGGALRTAYAAYRAELIGHAAAPAVSA